jgi:hypothetical protein
MDTGRLSQGALIAAISGLVLFISLFFDWVGIDVTGVGSASQTGWESQSSLDIYLLIVSVIAVVPAVLALTGGGGDLPIATAANALLLGTIAVILMFFTMFIGFPDGLDRKFGIWLALIASVGVAVGGYLAAQEEAMGERY